MNIAKAIATRLPRGAFGRGLAWLLFLGPLFFLSYGWANHFAADRHASSSIWFEWEKSIPFIPWTIVPYWSIDLLYGLSFLMCKSPRETDRHGLRLLATQAVAIFFFAALPLRFAFDKPSADGFFGAMFNALAQFDLPYNQAPSLHIALAIVLGWRFAHGKPSAWQTATWAWAGLICASVLTTYQHHFFDIPTGAALGTMVLWLIPDEPAPATTNSAPNAFSSKIAALYFSASAALIAAAVFAGGAWLFLAWPALSLACMSLIYAEASPFRFGKTEQGRAWPASALLWPSIALAWVNSRAWTSRRPQPDLIADGVSIGRWPGIRQASPYSSIVDLAPEMPRLPPSPTGLYKHIPFLDLVAPSSEQLRHAAQAIESSRLNGSVLVCCALGYSRSACAVAAWLLLTRRARTCREAIDIIRARRPVAILGPEHLRALQSLEIASGGAIP